MFQQFYTDYYQHEEEDETDKPSDGYRIEKTQCKQDCWRKITRKIIHLTSEIRQTCRKKEGDVVIQKGKKKRATPKSEIYPGIVQH